MKKKAAKIFTAFIMTAIIAQGTVMVAGAAETDSTPDSVAVVEVATPDSSRTTPVQKMERNKARMG